MILCYECKEYFKNNKIRVDCREPDLIGNKSPIKRCFYCNKRI